MQKLIFNRKLWLSVGVSSAVAGYVLRPKSNSKDQNFNENIIPKDSTLRKLTENELKFTSKYIKRMDINSINSNEICEDQHSQFNFKNSSIIGIYDGHSGPECGRIIAKYLTSYVSKELEKTKDKVEISSAIKKAFTNLDNDIINGALHETKGWSLFAKPNLSEIYKELRNAVSGACALVAIINEDDIYVACVGDCRAVLGRKRSETDGGVYEAIELSKDQTARCPNEFSRLCEEHPGEDATVVVRGRILGGLMPSRSFGDARYKWSQSIQDTVLPFLFPNKKRSTPPNFKTPPYVTALPEVVHYPRDKRDEFLIMATDGLWDEISSESSIKIVSDLLKSHYSGNYATALIKAGLSDYEKTKKFEDFERIEYLFSIPAPKSRRYRDDMTVNVIFLQDLVDNENCSEVVESFDLKPFGKPQLEKWLKAIENKVYPRL